jgi:hypothetical protein
MIVENIYEWCLRRGEIIWNEEVEKINIDILDVIVQNRLLIRLKE